MSGAGIPIPRPVTAGEILSRLGLTSLTAGAIIYAASATTLDKLPIGTAGRLLVAGASAPAWSSKLAEGTITGLMTFSKAGSTAREMTFPDAAITVAGINLAQTWTQTQTVPSIIATGGSGPDIAVTACSIASPSSIPRVFFTKSSGAADEKVWGIQHSGTGLEFRSYLDNLTNSNVCLTLLRSGSTAIGVQVPNGTAAAPGIRLTSEAHGLYRVSATSLGFAVAGTAAASLTSAGDFSATKLSATNASNSAGSALLVTRSVSTGTASQVYNGSSVTFSDTSTVAGVTYYSTAYRGGLNITGTGDNAGYDRGLTFEAYHRSSGTRASVTGAFIEAGTWDGGSDSTGTITTLRGIHIQALKTASSTVATSALIEIGTNVGTTQYAIRTASNSGVVLIRDTTDATTTADGSVRLSGGLSQADGKQIVQGATSFHYWGSSGTDGSWRFGRSGNNFVIERRESGAWVTKQTIAA